MFFPASQQPCAWAKPGPGNAGEPRDCFLPLLSIRAVETSIVSHSQYMSPRGVLAETQSSKSARRKGVSGVCEPLGVRLPKTAWQPAAELRWKKGYTPRLTKWVFIVTSDRIKIKFEKKQMKFERIQTRFQLGIIQPPGMNLFCGYFGLYLLLLETWCIWATCSGCWERHRARTIESRALTQLPWQTGRTRS